MDLAEHVLRDVSFSSRYELGEKFAEGGMGAVHRGLQRALQRAVAIKVMNPDLLRDTRYRDRFITEAKLAARLIHMNVVAIHDFGVAGDVPYIVSEYVEGESLVGRLARLPPLTPLEIQRIAIQTLQGLQAIHDLGVIHRDLKPGNVMLAQGPRIQVKIVDFGIAKEIRDPNGRPSVTRHGTIVGTPDYMSPEQCLEQPLTSASDLYSLTVMLYQMILGKLPFTAASVVQQLNKHIAEVPAIPTELADPVGKILLRGLAKDPEDRFPSAEEFIHAMESLDPALLERGWFTGRMDALPPTASNPSTLIVPAESGGPTAIQRVQTTQSIDRRELENEGPTPKRRRVWWEGVAGALLLIGGLLLVAHARWDMSVTTGPFASPDSALIQTGPDAMASPLSREAWDQLDPLLKELDIAPERKLLFNDVRRMAARGLVSEAAQGLFSPAKPIQRWNIMYGEGPQGLAGIAGVQAFDWALTGLIAACVPPTMDPLAVPHMLPGPSGKDPGATFCALSHDLHIGDFSHAVALLDRWFDTLHQRTTGTRRFSTLPPHGPLNWLHDSLQLTYINNPNAIAVATHRLTNVMLGHPRQPVGVWSQIVADIVMEVFHVDSQRRRLAERISAEANNRVAMTQGEVQLEAWFHSVCRLIRGHQATILEPDRMQFRQQLLQEQVASHFGAGEVDCVSLEDIKQILQKDPATLKRVEEFARTTSDHRNIHFDRAVPTGILLPLAQTAAATDSDIDPGLIAQVKADAARKP